ncbi:serine hydrolase domain-containing protein [Pseudoalteromonas sp. T1lg65]|uniref:serine hydrolase domain-containing protein n=1 Tax=Pseudoalteromonas sp. T1lg65 TaxID=2077101 RepID=UPI003F7AB20D
MAIKLICKTMCTVVFLSSINLYAAGSKVARASAPEANQAQINGAYRDIQPLEQAYISIAPEDRKDGLMVGELGIDGGKSALMVKLAEEIGEGKHSDFDSLLIVHQGKLLFESYYSRGRINLPHYQASATKAYTGLALGRAIQLGYLTMADLDKPLISFLKDLDTKKLVKGAEKVTLHKALTMHSGIRLSREQKEIIEKDPTKITGQAHVQAYLEHSTPITSESQTFRYQADPMLVMQVIEAVVPGSAEDFIKKELLDKLGITNYLWRTDINGLPVSGSRTTMTSRDMVKWGLLTKNKGKWNGEQLIPEAYINRAANRILLTGDDDIFGGGKDVFNQGYGYYWWSADMKYGGKKYFTRSAQGGGGQYIILIDELDLMVVVTANNRNDTTLQLTAERILPAFVK